MSLAGGLRLGGQSVFRTSGWPAIILSTTKTTGFNPIMTKTGATLRWAWGDGTYTDSNAPTKNYPAGTKTLEVWSVDGFAGVTVVALTARSMIGPVPSFARFPALVTCALGINAFSGALPSLAPCTALVTFACNTNSLSGSLPSFAACTSLRSFAANGNSFSGTLPSFAPCTALTDFRVDFNSLTDVVAGSFATQKSLATAILDTSALVQSAVDQVLADLVVSLGIPGRVLCTVDLGGNAPPSAAGLANKATLIAAGWTVFTA